MGKTRRDFLAQAAGVGMGCALAGIAQPGIAHPRIAQPQGNASSPAPLRFGVNYTPRRLWWYCWQDWDQQAILDDLEGIASLGMDHIRAQCLWPVFQPGINVVNERAVENLHRLLDAADRCSLDVEVTVLNGWMSGLSFLPAWSAPLAVGHGGDAGNMFLSDAVIAAEQLLFQRIAASVGEHRRFLGFDIGNELGVLMTGANAVTTAQADAWATRMLGHCDRLAPGGFHVNGADHSHWFADFGFSRSTLANTGAATAIHSYIYFDGVLNRFAPDSPEAQHLAAYEVELATAYQHDPARPVWVEEIGVGDVEMPAAAKPGFMERTVELLARRSNLWGITWWCSHDIDPAIGGFSTYEYTLGLLDGKNRAKPLGRQFASLARTLRQQRPQPLRGRTALVIPDAGPESRLSSRAWPPDWRFASAWMRRIAMGNDPAIVLESRADDEDYLRQRGINNLVPLAKA